MPTIRVTDGREKECVDAFYASEGRRTRIALAEKVVVAAEGGVMVGVHYGCSIPDATRMQLSAEHCASQWVTAAQAQALFPAGHWLRALIARAEVVRELMPHALRQLYRHEGFEL